MKHLYDHLLPISQTIQVRKHEGHCWRSKDELINDILQWTPTHGHANISWPAGTYLHQLCANTGCSLVNLPGVMDNMERERERKCGSGKSMLAMWHDDDDLCLYIFVGSERCGWKILTWRLVMWNWVVSVFLFSFFFSSYLSILWYLLCTFVYWVL